MSVYYTLSIKIHADLSSFAQTVGERLTLRIDWYLVLVVRVAVAANS